MPIPTPNPIDLASLGDTKDWIADFGSADHVDDDLLAGAITAASREFLRLTGFTNGLQYDNDGKETGCIFNTVITFEEEYDGTGSHQFWPDMRPVQSISVIHVNGRQATASTAFDRPGYFIERSKKSIAFRSSPITGDQTTDGFSAVQSFALFRRGKGNIHIIYNAGYASVPEDIQQTIKKIVALNYKRRATVDNKQQMVPQGGTVTHFEWDIPPECRMTVNNYSRVAVLV